MVLLTHGKTPAVDAGAVYHGSMITKTDIAAINAPILFLQSDPELDTQLNSTTYKQVCTVLDTRLLLCGSALGTNLQCICVNMEHRTIYVQVTEILVADAVNGRRFLMV